MRYMVEIQDQDTGAFGTFQSDDLELAVQQAKTLLTESQPADSNDTD